MKFLVVGDEMVDRYYIGSVNRLNPEKHSAPLLTCREVVNRPGGAGNVAANIRAMWADVAQVSQNTGMPLKCRLLDDNDGVVARFDHDEECTPVHPMDIAIAADGSCAVVVSDYGKGAIDDDVACQIRELGLPTFVDAKVCPERWAGWCTAMLPNEAEYRLHKLAYSKTSICVVKRGAKGACFYSSGMLFNREFPSKAKFVRNVSGAGDTVLAAYAVAYMSFGESERRVVRAIEVAMDFAAAAVAEPLTSAPTFQDAYPSGIPVEHYPMVALLKK